MTPFPSTLSSSYIVPVPPLLRLIPALFLSLAAAVAAASERPNILWITTEDMSLNLGSYGDPDAVTPHLDRLAAGGVRFTEAHAPAGVCAPARSALITGVHASTLGSQHMRSQATLPDFIRPLPAYLRELGYYASNNLKEDYNFAAPADTWDESGREAHWRRRAPGQPFFSVFNFMTTHESRMRFDDEAFVRLTARLTPAQRHDPARVTLPGWLPDTPAVRREWARYHDLISAMDHQVGDLLQQLAADGLADDTIVFFFSDHGAGLPRAKQFVYDSGLRVPLLVHVPEKWRHLVPVTPGAVEDRLVSLIDLAPTVLALAGLEVPAHMQGRVFLGRDAAAPRTHVHAIRDRMDERIDMNRTVSDGRFKYHRNYLPHRAHFPWLDYMDRLETSKEFRRLAAIGALPPGLAAFMADRQGLEELYDLASDPDELRNLAGDPAHAETLHRLREQHFAWVRETVDTGLVPEHMLRSLSSEEGEYAFARGGAYELERTLAAARLVERGAAALPDLRQALVDDHGPVRYWAAAGLAALGEPATAAAPELVAALDDEFPEVALMAAEALAGFGRTAAALPVVTRHLEHDDPLVRLAAANLADRLGAAAAPLTPLLRRVAEVKPAGDLPLMVQWVAQHALRGLDALPVAATGEEPVLTPAGVAAVDITPGHPVRLHGFPRGERSQSTDAVTQRIYAKALAIGEDAGNGPVLLLTADLLGVSEAMVTELADRLAREAGFTDRTRLTVTATHNHSAPALSTVAPFVFRQPPSATQAEEISRYETWLMDRLVEVAMAALRDRQPALLAHAKGQAAFASQRRVVVDGKWQAFGDNAAGPVDHDLPIMTVRDPAGALRAVWLSYACHGVCWQKPSVHGDWMGVAQARIEAAHPGALALVTIGCAGDINPLDQYFRGEDPVTPGEAAAAEVERLLSGSTRPLSGAPETQMTRFELPLQAAPGIEHWAGQQDRFSRTMHERLTRGEAVAEHLPYVAQTWMFGDDLAVVFLAGEVHVDYGLRLKRDFDADRLWVNAYANASPAYIPTAAQLPEGGWEVDGSRLNYGVPARLDPAAEELLHERVAAILPDRFRPGAKPKGATGEWWKNTGHPKGKWWLTYPGYEGDAADKIWETVPIPPSPVLSPEEALESFVVDERFRVEIVAAEPLVVRPVFFRFDEAGRLWVVEMPGYMRDIDGTDEEKPSGRVVVLEDTNGDGQMDKATTFLDGLVMPRTLALVPGGALVVEPPRIWLARDLNGDLVADEKILLSDTYGEYGNPEHSANGLLPALDNWMYSAKSAVRYQFRGDQLIAEPTVFRGQWGISQDDTGRLYYNYNASPLHVDLAPGEYLVPSPGIDLSLRRNVRGPMLANVSIVEDKSLHPVRVTPLVTLGASDLRPDGTLKQFTAASSPFIYRGALFPPDFVGDAFVADPVGNLIQHFRVQARGVALAAAPAVQGREFLASRDERFRPVFLETGPEGALYLADMYTGIVEHKRYVTEYLRKQVLGRDIGDFTETGRIYRVVPVGTPASAPVRLDPTAPAEWVARLDSADGWVRDTAQRLLVQGGHTDVAPQLRTAVSAAGTALGRLHALWTLEGLDRLDAATIGGALDDADPRVRSAAVRLADRLDAGPAAALRPRIHALATDADPTVRLQVLLSLGRDDRAVAGPVVWRMLREGGDGWLAPAAATGLHGLELAFIEEILTEQPAWTPNAPRTNLLQQLGFNVLARSDATEVAALVDVVGALPAADWRAGAVWRGAAAYQRNGPSLTLPREPGAAVRLAQSPDEELRAAGEALMAQLTWPDDRRQVVAELPPLTSDEQVLFDLGKQQYALICAACHQANGMGLSGVAPTLVGSEWVVDDKRVPVEIIIHGLIGPITVRGEQWNMVMPGLGAVPGLLDDEKIAGLTTYLRRAWGNQATAVTPEEVARVRALSAGRNQMWTADELKTLPAFEPARR